MKTFCFLLLLFVILPSISFGAGFLPRDRSKEVIQGTAPDIFTELTIGASGTNTLDVTSDITVRFKCDYPVTYHFGSGIAWPVAQNKEEYQLIPTGKTTLHFFSDTNPTYCYIQESRR